MAERELNLILRLKDQASQDLKSFDSRIQNMQPTFRKMAAVGTAAFVGITAAVYKSTKAYAEVERANRQLEHAVIGVSKGTWEQVEAISAASMALEKKVGIDGEALKMGAAQLSTFGLQSQSVVDLTKSLADFTVNQNGLNASSEQYITSANTMAKALRGQFGILEKSGIRFTEAQQNMILYGTETEKVTALQQGLAQNLRETTDTVGGLDVAMAKSARASEALQDAFGAALAPVVMELNEALLPLVENFTKLAEENPELVKGITLTAASVSALIAIMGFLGLAIEPIKNGFIAAFNAIKWAFKGTGLVITALVVAVGMIIKKLNEFGREVGGMGNAWLLTVLQMKISFAEFVESVLVNFSKIPFVGKKVEGALENVRKNIKMAEWEFKTLAEEGIKKTQEATAGMGNEFSEAFNNAIEGAEGASEGIEKFASAVESAFKQAADGIKAIRDEILAIKKEIEDATSSHLKNQTSEERSYHEKVVDLVMGAESEIAKLERERREARKEGDRDLVREIDGNIAKQKNIIQSYYDLDLDLSKMIREEKKRMAMNEMERLAYDHEKKMILMEAAHLKEQILRLQKWVALEQEHEQALDYIGKEKLEAINAEIAKSKTFREHLAERMGGLTNWFSTVLAGYRKTVTDINREISKINPMGGSARMSVSAPRTTSVGDAIIRPDGSVIKTDPADWLFATKNPSSMGGGTNITVNVNGDVTGRDVVEYVKQAIMKEVKSYNRI